MRARSCWGGSCGASAGKRRSPSRASTAVTVDSGIPSVSAISGPLKRSRRRQATSCSRSGSVRPGTRSGAEERSSSPASPSRRKRAIHLQALRSLTPAASAARVSAVHLKSSLVWLGGLGLASKRPGQAGVLELQLVLYEVLLSA